VDIIANRHIKVPNFRYVNIIVTITLRYLIYATRILLHTVNLRYIISAT